MRATVTSGRLVIIDGEARTVPTDLPQGVRAMHWDGDTGFAERLSGIEARTWDDFQPWVDAWNAAPLPPAPPNPVPDPPPGPLRTIPPLEFLQRFTATERTAIRAAAAVNAELADWIDQARFAREIELDAPTTAAGLDALVVAGLLTAERRAAVLA